MRAPPDGNADNVLLIGNRPSHPEPPRAAEREALPNSGELPEVARELIERTLSDWGRGSLVATASLCATELLASAAEHSVDDVELELRDYGETVEVELVLMGADAPLHEPPDSNAALAPHFTVVDTCAALWGVVPLPGAERVWFELSG